MKFVGTPIEGAWLVLPDPHRDSRGEFVRVFCARELRSIGLEFNILQSNLVRTRHAGTVRGLHYQEPPAQESKLVRCIAGAVFDVIFDMRPESPTKHRIFWTRLDAEERKALFIPSGVAHGYQTLVDDADFMYLTDQYYVPGLEKGVRHDDPRLGVPWPLPARDITARDANWPLLGV